MEEFLHSLFRLVQSPQPCSADHAPFFASILHHIIRFNRPRIQTYLNQLYKHIGLCVSSLESEHVQASWRVKSGQLKTSLIELGSRVSRLESKTLPKNGEEETNSLADIIMFIHDMHIRGHGEAMFVASRESTSTPSMPWRQLRHAIARLRAYHVSTQSIISAHNCWPYLFEDVRIVTVPSSTPYLNPLIKGKTVTASQMLGRMVAPTEIELRRAEAKQLERFGLDNIFHTACNAESFTPLVHGEVLVHDFVSTYLLENPDTSYCHGLRYVGSSKPTCRLCSYYFYEVGDVGVRESHGNLYSKWRAPDVFDEEAAKRRDGILNAMVEMIRKDALRTLSSKLPRGKADDSSSFPTVAGFFAANNAPRPATETAVAALPTHHLSRVTTSDQPDVSVADLMADILSLQSLTGSEGEVENDEEGGGVIVYRGRQAVVV